MLLAEFMTEGHSKVRCVVIVMENISDVLPHEKLAIFLLCMHEVNHKQCN